MQYKTLTYSKHTSLSTPEKENIGVITMNRSKVLNAMNKELLTELDNLLEEIRNDKRIRVIIITGKGRAFSVGADLKEIRRMAEDEGSLRSFVKLGQNVFDKIEFFDKPIIASINGFALGGGLELALACDIRIASKNAKIGFPETVLGLLSAWGGCVRLTKLIGRGKATELILTGAQINTKEAKRIGLIYRAVPQEELNSLVMRTARTIAERSPITVKLTKKIMTKAMETNVEVGNKMMEEAFVTCIKTADIKKTLEAVLENSSSQSMGTQNCSALNSGEKPL